MKGDERTRFCTTCAKNVYNLSGMSRSEAQNLIRAKEGRLCARFYRRADGTIITDDCPVALRAMRRPLKWMTTTVAIVVAPLFTFAAVMIGGRVNASQIVSGLCNTLLYQAVSSWVAPQEPPMVMGIVMVAPPPTVAPSTTGGANNLQFDETDQGQVK
jgi:hypothetical protein